MAQLLVNGLDVDIRGIDPKRSLLQVLREDLRLTGTKEGCGSGDCGACTVVVVDQSTEPNVTRTVNSCITPLGALLNSHILTCEGLNDGDLLHPVQQAMVDEHGSQCGFCTPGFVMSLVGRQLQASGASELKGLNHDDVIRSISGNLCRCTGYRPIVAAALKANAQVVKHFPVDSALSVPALKQGQIACVERESKDPEAADEMSAQASYARPTNLAELNRLLQTIDTNSRWAFIAGSTDLWLEVTQRYQRFDQFIDLMHIPQLQGITSTDEHTRIGAAVSHNELLNYFDTQGATEIVEVLHRFGSPQIRGRGTIGGNIANASPIADWPPILLVLKARVVIANAAGTQREVALENYYLGYKNTVLADTEYLLAIEFDTPANWQAIYSHKISKREDDDISSILGAFFLTVENGILQECRIAFGGIAATPVRLKPIEDLLVGCTLSTDTTNATSNQQATPENEQVEHALTQLAQSIQPLTDVRASAAYRRAMCVNTLRNALERAAHNAQAKTTQEGPSQ